MDDDVAAAFEARRAGRCQGRGHDAVGHRLAHGGEETIFANLDREVVVLIAERAGHPAAARVNQFNLVPKVVQHGDGCLCPDRVTVIGWRLYLT